MTSSRLTFGQVMALHNWQAPGFNTIRVVLALGVILDHSLELTGHTTLTREWYFVWGRNFLVPAFFALSGFLVTGSMMRLRNTPKFIGYRALRIVPALLVETMLAALILGPMTTVLPLEKYFSDPQFRVYFLNIVGDIHYRLPGVFTDLSRNSSDVVNMQLWTIPSELYCYASLALLMTFALSYRPRVIVGVMVLGMIGVTVAAIITGHAFVGVAHWTTIVVCFYAGAVLFHYRDYVPIDSRLILVAAIAWLIALFGPPMFAVFLGPLSAAYLVCCAGMLRLPQNPGFVPGDYSYGLYLYGFPIQQAVIWWSHNSWAWYFNFVASVALAFGFAMVSWHVIEKPALALRHFIKPTRLRQKVET